MLVNLACDWGRPSRNWPCAWTQSDYCRFLLSIPRNRFLSTDLQSAFWKRFGKEPSFGSPMDLTNSLALLNDKAFTFVRSIGKAKDGSFPKRFQKALCKSVDKN